ncbi:MAG: succinate dehydrogenase, hydrophobic membrane anchor protein [Burkholderiales bacterium RIFCSPLOWO2_12_FULL_64_99]|jgi:succinate dehydrogenase / fumarate reductase membrane anchor subunit|uniref:succinate dehydrogenase, hydrophobic membrane anchor protein n=1 Tax=Aquabacterium sp. TaxID=1872578 RepID=UPI0008B22042|nr:succinate dehydrogenase, hydrophobic membrane anchor protein [Aquabacterium sp.]OGB02647.1 MAG: succinate dehydrogenase, hydrophobic membrane anchor protein [Burkholderiales bacterium RIFCSPHIGHO2_12_FULL_63_20]OGB64254.1 MAG: succinate dehydrogenase, hydrophobic membrane anchor protein [Burkholderiales bacterium RIFCSPLOWO2_12_FULL_64_99]OHC27304.1 MAG: succinate dehydrogenase, hydrophobic membrane anchor protein [Pseudomonadales bacterium RIFCSPLOWO2_12_59_9]
MSQNYGTKRIVTGAHYGLRDWLAQRVTAVLMALFTIVLLAQVIFGGPLGYDSWAGIFSSQWMKTLTFVVILAMLYHVWVGVREIFMDYIKPVSIRLSLYVFAIVWLVGCAGWAIQVLWRL